MKFYKGRGCSFVSSVLTGKTKISFWNPQEQNLIFCFTNSKDVNLLSVRKHSHALATKTGQMLLFQYEFHISTTYPFFLRFSKDIAGCGQALGQPLLWRVREKPQSWNWKKGGVSSCLQSAPWGHPPGEPGLGGGYRGASPSLLGATCLTSAQKTSWEGHKSTTINTSRKAMRPYVLLPGGTRMMPHSQSHIGVTMRPLWGSRAFSPTAPASQAEGPTQQPCGSSGLPR